MVLTFRCLQTSQLEKSSRFGALEVVGGETMIVSIGLEEGEYEL